MSNGIHPAVYALQYAKAIMLETQKVLKLIETDLTKDPAARILLRAYGGIAGEQAGELDAVIN